MPKTSRRRTAALSSLAAAALLAACSSSEPQDNWDGAENLQFSEDARDPTERERDAWSRFRPQETPVGTADPLSPDRRTHGFGGANNNP